MSESWKTHEIKTLELIEKYVKDPRDELPSCEECKQYSRYDDECDDPDLQAEEWPFCFNPDISSIKRNFNKAEKIE